MKRLICLLMCALFLFLLPACGGTPASSLPASSAPSSLPPALTEDALLLGMKAALETDGQSFVINYGGENPPNGQWIEVTPELLGAVATLLCSSPFEEYKVDSVSSQGDMGNIMLQGGAPYVMADLYQLSEGNTTPAVNGTLLWLQVGEEMKSYLYAPGVFDEVDALIEANLRSAESAVELGGSYLTLEAPQRQPEEQSFDGCLDLDGALALFSYWYPLADSAERIGQIDLYDTTSGALLYTIGNLDDPIRMERCDYEGYDLRVFTKPGQVRYYDTTDPDKDALVLRLPAELDDILNAPLRTDAPSFRTLDIDPVRGSYAVTGDDGISALVGGRRIDLPNSAIKENMPQHVAETVSIDPAYNDVRLMNGGQTLVATVMLPGSQIGHTGLMAYDIASGAQHWYFELFSLPVGGIAYPNDTTIIAAEEMALHTIDLTDYSHTTADSSGNMLEALTADFEHFAYMKQEMLADSRMGTTVYLDDPAEPLFTAKAPQGEVTLRGISKGHLVFRARGPEGWRLLLVAY